MNKRLEHLLTTLVEQLKPLDDKQTKHFEVAEAIYYDKETSREDRFIASQIMGAMEPLESAIKSIMRVTQPIKAEGTLRKNSLKRYEVDGYELTSSSTVEVLLFDVEEDEVGHWRLTRIEHTGDDYYLVAAPELPMQGVTARIR